MEDQNVFIQILKIFKMLENKKRNYIRNTTPRNDIYSPFETKRILTPSGNRIDTPLVGMNTPNLSKKIRKRNVMRRPSSIRKRRIDDLSPAAFKLMQKNMKSNNKSSLSTPLSSVLRDAYSSTPSHKKRKRNNQETPTLITPKLPKSKKRKFNSNDNVFKKPTHSIMDKKRKKKHISSNNITDGLL